MSVRDTEAGRELSIQSCIVKLAENNSYLDSVGSICDSIAEDIGIEAKPHEVRRILKEDFNMSYRKIKEVSKHVNSDRNLILRQQFAIKFIELFSHKKHIINIDETWLGMSDFRRMKWSVKGDTNSVPMVQVQPRISMIMGIGTNGAIYASLLQANSNSKVMELFFRAFVKKLDSERKNWR